MGFRSLGRERAEAAYRLVEAGLEKDLPGVPGFYVAEKNGKRYWSVAGMGGLVIPIRDVQGHITRLAVRLDEPPENGGKYRYVSSKKKGGPGSGAPVHVPKFEGNKTVVRVTEGALKATIATRLSGMLTIGLPGVSSWKRAARVLNDLGAKTARVAFDADARRNRNVSRNLDQLIGHLCKKGFTVELETWKAEDGKGIDDVLAAGKQPDVLTGDEAVDNAVREIVAEADRNDPTPAGPSVQEGRANEAYNDPHLLAREYRARVRFGAVHGLGGEETLFFHRQEFRRWDGRAYRMLDDKEVKAELTASIKDAFDRHNLKQLAAWRANGCEGNQPTAPQVTTKAVGNAMQALTGMALLPWSVESPAWLFGEKEDWAAGDVLACKNALLHLPSLVAGVEHRMAPTPLFFSPNALDYDFAPDALAPVNWLAFLHDLWPKDPQAIEALQEWFGYCLLPDTALHKILMIVGPKRLRHWHCTSPIERHWPSCFGADSLLHGGDRPPRREQRARSPRPHQGNCTEQRLFPVAFTRQCCGGDTPPFFMAAIFGEWRPKTSGHGRTENLFYVLKSSRRIEQAMHGHG
jgi:hypothetical protein